jgi:hypothetical protein
MHGSPSAIQQRVPIGFGHIEPSGLSTQAAIKFYNQQLNPRTSGCEKRPLTAAEPIAIVSRLSTEPESRQAN